MTQHPHSSYSQQYPHGGPSRPAWYAPSTGPIQQAPSGQLTGASRIAYPTVSRPDGSTGELVRIILASIAIGLLGFGLLLIILFQSLTFNGLGILIVLLSLVPMAFIFLVVLWFNRWKKRNPVWLVLPLLWGAVMAIVFTIVVQTLGFLGSTLVIGFDSSQSLFDLLYPVLGAPPIEEGAKGIFLAVFALAARRHFTGPLDGFIYGSLVGEGFAFTENLQYLSGSFDEGQFVGLAITFVLRGIVSPLSHSLFTAVAGVVIGFAAARWQWWAAILAWPLGWSVGTFLHALWNFMAGAVGGLGILGLLIIVGLALVYAVIWYSLAFVLRWLEVRKDRAMLDEYRQAGWLTPAEVDTFGTWRGRSQGKRWAAGYHGGADIFKKMVRTTINLANARQRINVHAGGEVEREREKKLLTDFATQRTQLMNSVNSAHSYQAHYPGAY